MNNKDSFTLKGELNELTLPSNAILFTFDAKSMYILILTSTGVSVTFLATVSQIM
jgi:hypothetical protein